MSEAAARAAWDKVTAAMRERDEATLRNMAAPGFVLNFAGQQHNVDAMVAMCKAFWDLPGFMVLSNVRQEPGISPDSVKMTHTMRIDHTVDMTMPDGTVFPATGKSWDTTSGDTVQVNPDGRIRAWAVQDDPELFDKLAGKI